MPEGRWAYWNEDESINNERSGIHKAILWA